MKKSFVAKVISIIAVLFVVIGVLTQTTVTGLCSSSSDPVYDSMTKPSESMSDYMIKANREYAKVYNGASDPTVYRVVSIGGLYPTSGTKLPERFSVYIGKIKLFAYSLSRGRWIVLDNQPYPAGVYIYTLPWTNTKAKQCKNVTYTDKYVKVDLTAKEMSNSVLHFWGKSAMIDKSDYLFYACAYEFWTDKAAVGKLTATNGIDAKGESTEYAKQLFTSRGLSSATSKKIMWGHTVPESEYREYATSSLNRLFQTGVVEPDLYTGGKEFGSGLLDPNLKTTKITKISIKNNTLHIEWKKRKKRVDGYQIQYSTNKHFRKKVKSKLIKNNNISSKTIKNLKLGKKYYVRIRTYRKIGKIRVYSNWSKIKSKKIG